MNVYRVVNEDTSGNPIYMDEKHDNIKQHIQFQGGYTNQKKMEDLIEMRIVCKEEECNRYELLTEECLEIHKKIFHRDQQCKDGHRPIEHCCSKINEGLKCNTLIETNIQGEPKYRDKKGKKIHR